MKKIIGFTVIVFFTLMTSCKKDFLDTGPTGSADEVAIFTTTTNASNDIKPSLVIGIRH